MNRCDLSEARLDRAQPIYDLNPLSVLILSSHPVSHHHEHSAH